MVDVGEMEIERPQKTEALQSVASINRCALKAQLLVEFKNGQVIAATIDKGKTHDLSCWGAVVYCLSVHNCV